MTLEDQSIFMSRLCRGFLMRDGRLADSSWHKFSQEDMLKCEAIQQTLAVMEMHGADRLIRDKIARERGRK